MCKLLLSWSLDVYEYLYSNNRRLQMIKNRLVFKCWCVALAQLWFHLNAAVLFFVITHRRIYLDLFYVFMHILWKNTAGDISFVFMLLCMSNWGRKKKKGLEKQRPAGKQKKCFNGLINQTFLMLRWLQNYMVLEDCYKYPWMIFAQLSLLKLS